MNGLRSRLGLVALALLAMGVACSSSGEGDAARLAVDGLAEVTAPGKEADSEDGNRALKYGERVKVIEGTATIRLDRGRELELRAGTDVVLEKADVEDGDDGDEAHPRLLDRDLLVHAPADARLTVTTDGAEVIVSGDAEVSRGAAVIVASFTGDVELRVGGSSTTVPALRQATIPLDGTPPGEPVAVMYNSDDPWNRRFLSEAIELGNELEARSKGFTAQLVATDGRTPDFLVTLLPALAGQPGLAGLFDAAREPGESLVGAAIVLEGSRGTFAERWVAVFGFRDLGAQWGLVAYDQGVTRSPLLAEVDAAIGRGPRPFEPLPLPTPGSGTGSPVPGGSGSTPGSGGSVPGSGGSTPGSGGSVPGSGGITVTSTPGPSPTVSTPVPPATPPNPNIGPLNTGIPILDDTINALVETLSGLLRSLGEG